MIEDVGIGVAEIGLAEPRNLLGAVESVQIDVEYSSRDDQPGCHQGVDSPQLSFGRIFRNVRFDALNDGQDPVRDSGNLEKFFSRLIVSP